jgi:hypothetical protein
MGIMDITDWLNTVQKPSLSGYNNAVKSHILASVWGGGGGGKRHHDLPTPSPCPARQCRHPP